jgi:hypothetical protein
VFSHVGPPASGIADELPPDLDLLDFLHLVLPAPFDLVGPAVELPPPVSVLSFTG